MVTNNPSLDLVEFIETQILPQYAAFDKAHNMEHVTRVIRRSLDLARKTGADLDMAYAIAAYHDLGLSGPRAIHHLTSGKILLADARLKRWFTADQLKMMKEAVESNHPIRTVQLSGAGHRRTLEALHAAHGREILSQWLYPSVDTGVGE